MGDVLPEAAGFAVAVVVMETVLSALRWLVCMLRRLTLSTKGLLALATKKSLRQYCFKKGKIV